MRKTRRLAVALAVSALVAAGGVTAGLVANAQPIVAGTCKAPGADANCNVTATIISPSSISVTISVTPGNQYPTYRYMLMCGTSTTDGNGAALTPYTQQIPLPYANPSSCTISVTATMPSGNSNNELSLEVDYTTGSPSYGPPPPGPVPVVRGYAGKCLDARGNSSANRTAVTIWSCNSSDGAQAFTFSNGELKHGGKCVNDQGNGGSGTKLILWTCNGASNEKWFHASSNGEYVLSLSSHGFLCVTDPGYSKTNGTQLIVSTCRNTSNQHWTT